MADVSCLLANIFLQSPGEFKHLLIPGDQATTRPLGTGVAREDRRCRVREKEVVVGALRSLPRHTPVIRIRTTATTWSESVEDGITHRLQVLGGFSEMLTLKVVLTAAVRLTGKTIPCVSAEI